MIKKNFNRCFVFVMVLSGIVFFLSSANAWESAWGELPESSYDAINVGGGMYDSARIWESGEAERKSIEDKLQEESKRSQEEIGRNQWRVNQAERANYCSILSPSGGSPDCWR